MSLITSFGAQRAQPFRAIDAQFAHTQGGSDNQTSFVPIRLLLPLYGGIRRSLAMGAFPIVPTSEKPKCPSRAKARGGRERDRHFRRSSEFQGQI